MKTQRAVSFDESSLESCGLTTTTTATTTSTPQDEHNQQCDSGNSSSRECWESRDQEQQQQHRQQHEVTSLEEAKNVIAALRARQRAQAHQMLAWRRTLKLQEELVARLTREKAEQLRSLSSQLLLFESRLCRKQKEIEASLAQREAIILRQQKVIKQLQQKLKLVSSDGTRTPSLGNLGSMHSTPITRDSPPCDALDRLDSLGDSDSAVVLEEAFLDDPTPPRFRSNLTDVTVIRSVSDAVEPANKYCAASRRSNGFLRRPEVLETVYSVEEDADADPSRPDDEADEEDNSEEPPSGGGQATGKSRGQQQQRQQQYASSGSGEHSCSKPRLRDLYGSFERLAQHETEESERTPTGLANGDKAALQRTRDDSQQAQQVTYNRVMSNHRSVTKPKDVKYKRINKAKSKSLEELRGRLRNWVEKGNKIAISLDQSYA